jgi:hypothetical protein
MRKTGADNRIELSMRTLQCPLPAHAVWGGRKGWMDASLDVPRELL